MGAETASCRNRKFGKLAERTYIASEGEGGRERRGLCRCGWVGKQAARTSRRLASALALIPCARCAIAVGAVARCARAMGLSGAAAPRSQRTIAPNMGAIVQMPEGRVCE